MSNMLLMANITHEELVSMDNSPPLQCCNGPMITIVLIHLLFGDIPQSYI